MRASTLQWAGFWLSLLFFQTLLTVWLHAPIDGDASAPSVTSSRAQFRRDSDCAEKLRRERAASQATFFGAQESRPPQQTAPAARVDTAAHAYAADVAAMSAAATSSSPLPPSMPLGATAADLPDIRSSSGGGCPASFMSGTDFAGSDLRMIKLALTLSSLQKQQQCCEECSRAGGCGGWTQANDACWLKKTSGLRQQKGLIGITSGFRSESGGAGCACTTGAAPISSDVDDTKELEAVGLFSESRESQGTCTAVCASVGRWCDASRFAEVNTCPELRRRFPCDACEIGYGLDLPAYRHFTVPFKSGVEGVCFAHATAADGGGARGGLPGARAAWEPRCDGAFAHSFRLCPCARRGGGVRGAEPPAGAIALEARGGAVGFAARVTIGASAVSAAQAAARSKSERAASTDVARILAWAPFEAVRGGGGKVDFVVAWARIKNDGAFEAAIVPARVGSIAVAGGVTLSAGPASPWASKCTASGAGLTRATVGQAATFTIVSRDGGGAARAHGGDGFFTAIVKGPRDSSFAAAVEDNGDGTYRATYTALDGGAGDLLSITVRFLGHAIAGSPFRVALSAATQQ
jgi:hypothetical protein